MSQSSSKPSSRCGRPPKPAESRLVHTGVRLGRHDRRQLALLATNEGISVSEYVRRLVWVHIAAQAA